ncbi:PAS domain-containing sensor histidine kinase [Archangium sp.]|uniref:PAS domain-containing sensor histidine kinase n=1 Tax=Archangium sp. TaxID=1872627 RepID=UPI002D34B29C|nr:ATP-binding protein [Archangium sp.]HYO56144.1 ATP-binding protein [Archangium sp.]
MRRLLSATTASVLISIFLAVAAILLLHVVLSEQQHMLELYATASDDAVDAERLNAESEHIERLARGDLITPTEEGWRQLEQARERLDLDLQRMAGKYSGPRELELLEGVRRAEQSMRSIARNLAGRRRQGFPFEELQREFLGEYQPARERLDEAISAVLQQRRNNLEAAKRQARLVIDTSAWVFRVSVLLGLTALSVLALRTAREFRRRCETQETAERNSAELEAMLSSIPDMVFMGDLQGIKWANPRGLAFAGVSRPEDIEDMATLVSKFQLREESTGEPLPPEETPFFLALQGKATTRTLQLRHPETGKELFVRSVAAPVRLKERTIGAVSVLSDITEQKRAERDLRVSEARLAGIITIAADAIITVDEEQRITLFNQGAERIFGYSSEEMLGQPLDVLIPERFRERHRQVMANFARGPSVARRMGERRSIFGLRNGGEEFPAEAAISNLELEGQKLLTVILRDISLQRRVVEEQRFLVKAGEVLSSSLDYEQTLSAVARLAVESIADWCIVYLSDDGQVRRLEVAHRAPGKQPLAEALRNFRLDMGRPFLGSEVLSQRAPLLMQCMTDVALESMAQEPRHLELLRQLTPRSLVGVPLLAGEQLLGGLVFVSAESGRTYCPEDLEFARELARLASLAVQNARLYRAAQRATQARDVVLEVVAHDLRNPLNAIVLSTQKLLRQRRAEAMDTGTREPLRSIASSAQRMGRLIEDLLDVARMEGGTLSVDPGPQPTAALLQEAVEALRPLATEVRLSSEVSGELPPVLADRDRLLQVFSNLLGNALKFTPPGGWITVSARVEGSWVCFSVRDTGPGISPDALEHLFDRFWQAQRGDRRGAGLGLSIAKGIIEAHGGRIWAESEPGHGSTFFFTVPIAREGSAHADDTLH